MMSRACVLGLALTIGAATSFAASAPRAPLPFTLDPYPSTYAPKLSRDVLITNVTLMDGLGGKMIGASLLLRGGKIAEINPTSTPAGVQVIDGTGKWLTPGLIDIHSHTGTFAPPLESESPTDVNEIADPNAANVWAEHSINVQDANFLSSLAAGLTTLHVLPGSVPLFGGRTVVLKNVPANTVQGKKFPGARQGLKIACGSNPKEYFGSKGRFPSSRMGNVAGHREGWAAARAYLDSWLAYERGEKAEPPARNFKNDTLAGALHGDLLVHIHCYRSGDMAQFVDMSKEFGFQITMFHHAVESYKISKLLKANGICSAVWADWWAFKPEAFDGLRENAAFIEVAGGCVTMHSDNRRIANHFAIEAAKAMSYGRRAGIDITPERALRWITSTPAKVLGIDAKVGSIGVGKDADVVVWSGNPFSVYSRPEKVFIDGVLLFDRLDAARQPVSDFELGQPPLEPVP